MEKKRRDNVKAIIYLLIGVVALAGGTFLLLYGFFCIEPFSNRQRIVEIIAVVIMFIGLMIFMYPINYWTEQATKRRRR